MEKCQNMQKYALQSFIPNRDVIKQILRSLNISYDQPE